MSNKATVVFTVDKAVGNLTDTFVGTNPQLVLNQIQNYVAGISGGSEAASVSVAIATDANLEATATGTLAGSTVALTDTATIAGYVFTCVDGRETTTVECVADVASSLNDTYFTFFSATDATKYYVWYNVDDAGTDPAVASATGIEVAIAADDTADTVAAATQAAIDLIASNDVTAEVTTDTVTLTNVDPGTATNAADGAAAAATGFTITVTNAGAAIGDDEFQIAETDALTMANLATAINAADTGDFVTATRGNVTITLTPKTAGAIGNAITLDATGGITESGTRLTGGASSTPLTSASYSYAR
jgi:phage tail sheath gpL-like